MELRYGIPFPPSKIILIGCGGTGGYIAPHLARIAYIVNSLTNYIPELIFIDMDTVEIRNINRQNFIYTDVGKNKAEVLAKRYSKAFGINIKSIKLPLSDNFLPLFDSSEITYLRSDVFDLSGESILIIDALDNLKTRYESIYNAIGGIFSMNINSDRDYTKIAYRSFDRSTKNAAIPVLRNVPPPDVSKLAFMLKTIKEPILEGSIYKMKFNMFLNSFNVPEAQRKEIFRKHISKLKKTSGLRRSVREKMPNFSISANTFQNALNITWISVGNNRTSGQVVITSNSKFENLFYGSVLLPQLFRNNVIHYYNSFYHNSDNIETYLKLLDPETIKIIDEISTKLSDGSNMLPSIVDLFPEQYNTKTILEEQQDHGAVTCALNAIEEPQNLPVNYTASSQVVEAAYNMIFGSINYSVSFFNINGNSRKIPIGENPFAYEVTKDSLLRKLEELKNAAQVGQ